MSLVVADASPVIFLAKLDRLALIRDIFPAAVLMPERVRLELTVAPIPPHERMRIDVFIQKCRIETVRPPRVAAPALSVADRHVLALAARHREATVLTDDRLVRRIALAQGHAVAGTLGLLIRAARRGCITRKDAHTAIDALVTEHRLRITVDVYREACRLLEQDT